MAVQTGTVLVPALGAAVYDNHSRIGYNAAIDEVGYSIGYAAGFTAGAATGKKIPAIEAHYIK